jgi:predicted glycoside hydrolase/deacetylase ChbG (UPF0249 family)
MAKEVIFVADDFGMSPEINAGILHAHRSGELTAASLMMAQPATEAAVQLARATPSLQVGWHLHLNDSVPATIERWPWGEVARQWELFQATGLDCRFINSHHHLHTHPFVYRALLETVGPQFSGWIRLGRPCAYRNLGRSLLWSALNAVFLERRRRLSRWRSTDTLWGVRPRLNARDIRSTIATLPDGFHEFLFHPRSRACPDTLCLLELRNSFASA